MPECCLLLSLCSQPRPSPCALPLFPGMRRGQLVRVQTWFMAQGRVGAQRDFTITCARTGRQLGRATR